MANNPKKEIKYDHKKYTVERGQDGELGKSRIGLLSKQRTFWGLSDGRSLGG